MTITMQNLERLNLAEMQEFIEGSGRVDFIADGREAVYGFIERVLKAQPYRRLSKGQKGVVRRFLVKVTGLSRAQVTRLIAGWRRTRRVKVKAPCRRRFARRYTDQDIVLLATVDAAHEDLSGPAVRRILEREYAFFGNADYQRLAGISVSHIYNLRGSEAYRDQRVWVHHTQARQVSIGERCKPDPQGRPGYLRVDTVHQGNQDGKPGLYHINAVDTVTQWQVVGCVETISERHLLPVLEAMLHQFPFRILGFHYDNGSEFLNRQVAKLLNKLLAEFTKSRAYRTTDNALVEGKNGAVVRKHIGYGAIDAQHAEAFQKFYTAYFNPYLNYHRPCGFATVKVLARGKRKRTYPAKDYRTPYEELVSLPDWEQYLKEGITAALLDRQARRMSDTEAAQRMQRVKLALLKKCRGMK
jgi:transposase InsO family protein